MNIYPHLLIAPPDTSAWTEPHTAQRRLQGEVAHQALALLEPGETGEAAVWRRLRQARTLLGVHPDQIDLHPLVAFIGQTLDHPLMSRLFGADVQALAEQEIVIPGRNPATPHTLVRVDRMVLLPDGTLWVLDFKLGPGDPGKDQAQVRNYQRLLADLLGRPCHGAIANLETADVAVLPPQAPQSSQFSKDSSTPSPASHFPPDVATDQRAHAVPPIRVFGLATDLIALLHDELLEQPRSRHHLALVNVQIIFPHRRPRIYLHQCLARSIGRPFFPPRCLSLEDWILRQACLHADDPPTLASLLDQAWILHGISQMPGISSATDNTDLPWHRFLPWGMRLAQVLDELDRELTTARDVAHPPEEMPAMAMDLLANLGEVQAAFHEQLAARNLTTPGKLAARLTTPALMPNTCLPDVWLPDSDLADSGLPDSGLPDSGLPDSGLPDSGLSDACLSDASLSTNRIYLCGLFALTRSEAALVQALRRQGAQLWWQADRPLPEPLRRWATQWQAELEWVPATDVGRGKPDAAPTDSAAPEPTFILAHDLHSELRQVAQDAASWAPEEQVAVILPEPGLLRPLLAHLPLSGAVNITLGLPLERTALGSLLHTLVRMARDKQLTGVGPSSRDYLDLWQNPWVRGIVPVGTSGPSGRIGQILQSRITPFLTAEDLGRVLLECPQLDEAENTVVRDLCTLFHEALELTTLAELRTHLHRLLAVLHAQERRSATREMHLEMHVVHALHTRILPSLEQALSRDQLLPPAALWSVFWNFLTLERVPFSGEPLTPWQVMGLLESRLMCFDRVIVLECVEGVLPRGSAPNPLLPEVVRPVLGLPPGHAEEQIIRYHLQRLMASAGEVRIYSRQGLSPNPLEGRTVPSRYWEQELWKLEKKRRNLLQDSILRVPLDLDLSRARDGLPEKSPVRALLRQRLERGLSLSALNTYLNCPVRFFKEQVANFPTRADPRHDPGAAVMGSMAHAILEHLFRPYCNQTVIPCDLLPAFAAAWDELVPGFLEEAALSPAARYFQIRLLRELLQNYLGKSEQPVHLLAVEQAVQRHLPGPAAAIRLTGRLDRVDLDQQTNLPLILDYKTGSGPLRKPLAVRRLSLLAEEIQACPPDQETAGQTGLARIQEELQDIQLPGYLYLYDRPALSGYVRLGEWDPGKGFMPLIQKGKKSEMEQNLEDFLDWQQTGLPAILEWIGRHILEAPFFPCASRPQTCSTCPWRTTCPWALED